MNLNVATVTTPETLNESIVALAEAMLQLQITQEAFDRTRKDLTMALEAVNAHQRAVDMVVTALRRQAHSSLEWGRSKGEPVEM